ncbi:MAG TPA: glutathione S-transferase family protein [Aliidongia sp.]|uniref:glutathione S-transferase family protein n=1 Tax=Aliidongia sp. TaxID=1914230 RepID=UPI002DDCE1B1|nr:glutathione S-transferase family protein [Aliidongia sp.]HEV2673978.1 glutathione S-transferase family protein [Aliidongia sp.]
MFRLIGNPGTGSAIVEAALALSGLPYETEMLDLWQPGPERDRLFQLNPLGQVPVLILPDGSVMTESAAMVLHIIDLAPDAGLAPKPGSATRPAFLRWLIFLVASIYPTFTYGDDPSRYVNEQEGRDELRAVTDAERQRAWRQIETSIAGPWMLGSERSALDLYVWAMVNWRPRRDWFRSYCPRLAQIADAVDAEPRLAAVKAENWPAA